MFEILKLRAKVRKDKEQKIREFYGNWLCGTCKYSYVHFDCVNAPHLRCKLRTEPMGYSKKYCDYHCEMKKKKVEVLETDVK